MCVCVHACKVKKNIFPCAIYIRRMTYFEVANKSIREK